MAHNNPVNEFVPVNNFVVEAVWDDDAEVWVAESDDVPGLITEADSREHLIEKLAVLIPELLELNNRAADPHKPIDLLLHFRRKAEEREERVRLPKAA
jgi:predicted RNase H-like HicB family nuclease